MVIRFDFRPFTVEVAGGLGSQFFGYFAGQYFSQLFDSRLRIDLVDASYAHSDQFDITSFDLPGHFSHPASHTIRLRRFLRRVGDHVRVKFSINGRFIGRFTKRFVEIPGSAFDYNLKDLLTRSHRISGFYVTYRYLELLQQSGQFETVKLKRPSDWFLQLEAEARLTNPVMIHIRRGDFLDAKDTLGVLREEYFANAIANLPDGLKENPYWIFSNDISHVMEWTVFDGEKVKFIYQAADGDPAESLKLFTLGSACIISNSSFSFFGAMLSERPVTVICPEPSAKDTTHAMAEWFPPAWTRIPSLFL